MTDLTLRNNKFLDFSKLKAFADEKINLTLNRKFLLGWVENIAVGRNIAGKRRNSGYQHFLFFPQCLKKASFSGR